MKKRKKKRSKKIGQKFEKKVQKTINSGSLWFNKGDLQTKDYVIECKFTEKKSYRISTKMLDKLWEESLDANKLPLLIIGIENKNCKYTLKVDISKEVK